MRFFQETQWKTAADKTINSLRTLNVYSLLPGRAIPHGRKAIGTNWVFTIKADGTLKGRLVIQGWGQVPGIDCSSNLAPVCRLQIIRVMLTAVTEMN